VRSPRTKSQNLAGKSAESQKNRHEFQRKSAQYATVENYEKRPGKKKKPREKSKKRGKQLSI